LKNTSNIKSFSEEVCQESAALFTQGGLICFPTETVYALAANPFDDKAVMRIYASKQRSPSKPLSLLVSNLSVASHHAEIPQFVYRLADRFSPGPLTYVLKRKKDSPLSLRINHGFDSIGIRIPSHPLARRILETVGGIMVGTSTNYAGEEPACSVQEISAELRSMIDLIIDDGPSPLRKASTVIDATTPTPSLLREGDIAFADILREIWRGQ
jgi:L-threonylcarbamoyladenylate synthase